MDKPFNGGYICEKHSIEYIGKCPSCLSVENPLRQTKKQAKRLRQLKRKNKK